MQATLLSPNARGGWRDGQAEGAENSYFFHREGNVTELAFGPSFYNFFEVFDLSR